MRTLLIPLLLLFSAALVGCDSILMSRLLVKPDITSNSEADVTSFVDAFASKNGFSCAPGEPPILKSCRAPGPRFLSLERKDNASFVIELGQPFPGTRNQAPKSYLKATKELEASAQKAFGSAVVVESRE